MFADYQPHANTGERRELPNGLIIREANISDAAAIARISHERNGGDYNEFLLRSESELERLAGAREYLVLVAALEDEVVAFARAGYFSRQPDHPADTAPDGWYLGGVIVRPAFRRRGIAHELTRQRLEYVAMRSNEVFYFVNAQNQASIDLHDRFGFQELTRDFFHPSASFSGGVGILYRLGLV